MDMIGPLLCPLIHTLSLAQVVAKVGVISISLQPNVVGTTVTIWGGLVPLN